MYGCDYIPHTHTHTSEGTHTYTYGRHIEAYEQRQLRRRRPTDSYISKLIKVATSVEFSR